VTLPDSSTAPGALILEYRVGMAGQGDSLLYGYGGDGMQKWVEIGKYLKGVDNNPYVFINRLRSCLSPTILSRQIP
jgi:hypothetical protein